MLSGWRRDGQVAAFYDGFELPGQERFVKMKLSPAQTCDRVRVFINGDHFVTLNSQESGRGKAYKARPDNDYRIFRCHGVVSISHRV